MQRVQVVDSHTGGEPTRVVLDGGPDLGSGSLAERREHFRREFDTFRSAVSNEPRGSDPMVGALLCPPSAPGCVTGVIFFNNVGYLGMCVHGTIGLVVTLAYLGRIRPGSHRIDTPVGVVTPTLHEDGEVAVRNVPSRRVARQVPLDVPGVGLIHGDIAWGGNWFFLVEDHRERIAFDNVERLTEATWRIRQALERDGITGEQSGEIDHVELFGPSDRADSRNFVLCPGKQYDRSPCGTGTSAKLACLFGDGRLAPGQIWRQESIVGSIFTGTVEIPDTGGRVPAGTIPSAGPDPPVVPIVRGSAFVTAEATLLLLDADPFRDGIRDGIRGDGGTR